MSYLSSKFRTLATRIPFRQMRSTSHLSAANILNTENLNRCLECIQKRSQIQMKWSKSDVEAAVLVPLCVDPSGEVSLLYTRRSGKLSRHVRQVSFPGGIKDPTDASFTDCALRETEEEIGLPRSRVKICGSGSIMYPPRGAAIMPIFGIIENLSMDELKLNHDEVDEVFTAPVSRLSSKACTFHTQFRYGYSSPVFIIDNNKIWGLTGVITYNFLSCLIPDSFDKNVPFVRLYKKVT